MGHAIFVDEASDVPVLLLIGNSIKKQSQIVFLVPQLWLQAAGKRLWHSFFAAT